MAYLNLNDKTKTREANLAIISIEICYICLVFFSFCLILGVKWTLSHQVIAVLYVHVKIKKGILCGGKEMVEVIQGNCWKEVYV